MPQLGGGQACAAAPGSIRDSGGTTTFGNVLSAEMRGDADDGPTGEAGSIRQVSRATEMPSGRGVAGTSKSEIKRHCSDNLALAQNAHVSDVVSLVPSATPAWGISGVREEGWNAVLPTSARDTEDATETVSVNTGTAEPVGKPSEFERRTQPTATGTNELSDTQQQVSASSDSPDARSDAGIPNLTGINANGLATTRPLTVGDALLSPAMPSHGFVAETVETSLRQPTNNVPSPDVTSIIRQSSTRPASEAKSNGETAEFPSELAALSSAWAGIEQAVSKTHQNTIPTEVEAGTRNRATSASHSEEAECSRKKPDTSDRKPLQPADNPPAQPSAFGDPRFSRLPEPKIASAGRETQDGQGERETAGTPVLLLGEHFARGASQALDVKPQGAPVTADWSLGENVQGAPAVIHASRVLERMGQSELRLGLNTSDFGTIELHTCVSQDRVGASIVTTHTALHAAMVAEIPSLENAVAQHHLRLDSFNVDSRTGAHTGNGGASAGDPSGSRGRTLARTEVREFNQDSTSQESSLPQVWMCPYSSGLSIHA